MLYIGIFFTAFFSATLVPFGSEAAVLAGVAGGASMVWVFIVATVGNALGAGVNYALGRYAGRAVLKKWLKIGDETLNRSEQFFKRYGRWSLLLSGVPGIGDPITVLAGVLRMRWYWFWPLVTVGKALRYVLIIGAYQSVA